MISVGVRDLENQLTQYLDAVKSGERVLITEHDQVVAEISLPQDDITNTNVEEKLQQMSASGKLIRAKRNKSYQKKEEVLQKIDWISEYQENRYS